MTENKNELNLAELNRAAGGSGVGGSNPAYCTHPSTHYAGGSRIEDGKTLYRFECDVCHRTVWREEDPMGGGGALGGW